MSISLATLRDRFQYGTNVVGMNQFINKGFLVTFGTTSATAVNSINNNMTLQNINNSYQLLFLNTSGVYGGGIQGLGSFDAFAVLNGSGNQYGYTFNTRTVSTAADRDIYYRVTNANVRFPGGVVFKYYNDSGTYLQKSDTTVFTIAYKWEHYLNVGQYTVVYQLNDTTTYTLDLS